MVEVGENIFIIDGRYVIRKTSRRLRETIGAESEAQLVGKTCYQIFFHKDQPCKNCPVQRSIARRAPLQEELMDPIRLKRRVKATPVINGDGVSAVIVDCIDEHTAAALSTLEPQAGGQGREPMPTSKPMPDAEPVRAVLVDGKFTILFMNSAAKALVQPGLQSGVGHLLFSALSFYNQPQVRSLLERFAGDHRRESFSFLHPFAYGGEAVEFTFIRLPLAGKPDALLLLSRTKSRMHEIHSDLLHREKMHLLSRFAAKIAHDFRNYLAPMSTDIEFLKSDMISVTSLDGMFELLEYVEKLQGKINEMVCALETLEALKPYRPEKVEEIDLGKLITRAAAAALLSRPHPHNDIIVAPSEVLPTIMGIETHLEKALVDLFRSLLNMAGENGRLRISAHPLYEQNVLAIVIQVNSPLEGFVDVGTLMNEFVSGKEPLIKNRLGFLTAYGVVLNHNGSLTFSRRENGRSEIIIRLPRLQRA
ncbi:MAG: hypothetical protein ONB12_09980 [candidate division KSB1 bacterium]|nr:hypothetical protein [candidate division KSB1 bacterium]